MTSHRHDGSVVLRRPMRFRRWWVLLPVFMTVSCPEDDDEESCWCVPDVKEVRIVPGRFEVTPGSTFELRARLYAEGGTEIPEFFSYVPLWTITAAANVTVLRRDGHSVVLEVPTTVAVSTFTVIAEAGSAPGVASPPVTVSVNKVAPSNDYLDAEPHVTGNPLSVALAADATEATSYDVTPVVFSGFGDLGNKQTGGGAMVFSSDRAMAFTPVGWTTASDDFLYKPIVGTPTAQQDPQPPLIKDVTLWIDPFAGDDQWTATTAEAVARIHLADATRTFQRNRVGVEFRFRAAYSIIAGTVQSHCFDWGPTPVQGEPVGGGPSQTFDPTTNTDAIDVFVINLEGGTGKSCLDPDGSGYRVFLNARFALPNVLGHELGHVLLRMDNDGDHADGLSIGPTNLLVQGDADNGAPRRSHLSIGQACQINKSAVVSALRAAVPLPVPTVCPPVTKDVP